MDGGPYQVETHDPKPDRPLEERPLQPPDILAIADRVLDIDPAVAFNDHPGHSDPIFDDRFFFFSNEEGEPPHIHVKAGNDECKFWLDPVQLEVNYGFNTRELTEIRKHVSENRDELLEAWNEYFDEE